MTAPSQKPKVVAFDLDGTLIDSRGDIAAACNYALTQAGREALPLATICGFVGDGARSLVAGAFKLPPSAPELDAYLEDFTRYYIEHPVENTVVLPYVREVLAELKGEYQLLLCTNKARVTTDRVMAGLGMAEVFSHSYAGGDSPHKKPEPEPLLILAEKAGVSPHELIMVGDGPQDILAAKAAGAYSVGLLGGILPEARLIASEPDVLLPHMGELPAFLRRHFSA